MILLGGKKPVLIAHGIVYCVDCGVIGGGVGGGSGVGCIGFLSFFKNRTNRITTTAAITATIIIQLHHEVIRPGIKPGMLVSTSSMLIELFPLSSRTPLSHL